MTSNPPLEIWGKLLGDVPSATAILDQFLHHVEIVRIAGCSYRLQHQSAPGGNEVEDSKSAIAPSGSEYDGLNSKPAKTPSGSKESGKGGGKTPKKR